MMRVLELLLGMTVVPRCTAHDSETVPDELLFFSAMFVKISSVRIFFLASWLSPPRVLNVMPC